MKVLSATFPLRQYSYPSYTIVSGVLHNICLRAYNWRFNQSYAFTRDGDIPWDKWHGRHMLLNYTALMITAMPYNILLIVCIILQLYTYIYSSLTSPITQI